MLIPACGSLVNADGEGGSDGMGRRWWAGVVGQTRPPGRAETVVWGTALLVTAAVPVAACSASAEDGSESVVDGVSVEVTGAVSGEVTVGERSGVVVAAALGQAQQE